MSSAAIAVNQSSFRDIMTAKRKLDRLASTYVERTHGTLLKELCENPEYQNIIELTIPHFDQLERNKWFCQVTLCIGDKDISGIKFSALGRSKKIAYNRMCKYILDYLSEHDIEYNPTPNKVKSVADLLDESNKVLTRKNSATDKREWKVRYMIFHPESDLWELNNRDISHNDLVRQLRMRKSVHGRRTFLADYFFATRTSHSQPEWNDLSHNEKLQILDRDLDDIVRLRQEYYSNKIAMPF